MAKVNKNERKLLLLADKNKGIIHLVGNMKSVVINIRIKKKILSPEYFQALQNLIKKKYVYCKDIKISKTTPKGIYSLTCIGKEKVKLLKACKYIIIQSSGR